MRIKEIPVRTAMWWEARGVRPEFPSDTSRFPSSDRALLAALKDRARRDPEEFEFYDALKGAL